MYPARPEHHARKKKKPSTRHHPPPPKAVFHLHNMTEETTIAAYSSAPPSLNPVSKFRWADVDDSDDSDGDGEGKTTGAQEQDGGSQRQQSGESESGATEGQETDETSDSNDATDATEATAPGNATDDRNAQTDTAGRGGSESQQEGTTWSDVLPASVRMELRPQRPPQTAASSSVSSVSASLSRATAETQTRAKSSWRSKYGDSVILPKPVPFARRARNSTDDDNNFTSSAEETKAGHKEHAQDTDGDRSVASEETEAVSVGFHSHTSKNSTERRSHRPMLHHRPRERAPALSSASSLSAYRAEADVSAVGADAASAITSPEDTSDWTKVLARGRKPRNSATTSVSATARQHQHKTHHRGPVPTDRVRAEETTSSGETQSDFKKTPRMCYFVSECQSPSEVDPASGRAWPYCRRCYETRSERCLADQCQTRCPLKRYPVGTFQLYCAEHR